MAQVADFSGCEPGAFSPSASCGGTSVVRVGAPAIRSAGGTAGLTLPMQEAGVWFPETLQVAQGGARIRATLTLPGSACSGCVDAVGVGLQASTTSAAAPTTLAPLVSAIVSRPRGELRLLFAGQSVGAVPLNLADLSMGASDVSLVLTLQFDANGNANARVAQASNNTVLGQLSMRLSGTAPASVHALVYGRSNADAPMQVTRASVDALACDLPQAAARAPGRVVAGAISHDLVLDNTGGYAVFVGDNRVQAIRRTADGDANQPSMTLLSASALPPDALASDAHRPDALATEAQPITHATLHRTAENWILLVSAQRVTSNSDTSAGSSSTTASSLERGLLLAVSSGTEPTFNTSRWITLEHPASEAVRSVDHASAFSVNGAVYIVYRAATLNGTQIRTASLDVENALATPRLTLMGRPDALRASPQETGTLGGPAVDDLAYPAAIMLGRLVRVYASVRVGARWHLATQAFHPNALSGAAGQASAVLAINPPEGYLSVRGPSLTDRGQLAWNGIGLDGRWRLVEVPIALRY